MKEIDDLWKAEFGVKVSTKVDAPGHSLRDTADLMGLAHSTVSLGISIAEAHEKMPGLELDKCKTQQEMVKRLEQFKKMVVRNAAAKEADAQIGGHTKLTKNYLVGDFFEVASRLPNESFDLIELDPPYGIDLHDKRTSSTNDIGMMNSYVEVEHLQYEEFLRKVLRECWRLSSQNSWIVCWYAPEPWAEVVFKLLLEVGWELRRLPGVWVKPQGQTLRPEYNLGNASEFFYYGRKGDPQLAKPGRLNTYLYNIVPPSERVHPIERPIELMRDVLSTFCIEGSKVFIPFVGSGNTLLAAYDLKMLGVGCDLVKEYRDGFVSKVMKRGGEQSGSVED
jgi:site-specific DNA-methyltransferase (adenine-specific)